MGEEQTQVAMRPEQIKFHFSNQPIDFAVDIKGKLKGTT